MKLQMEDGTVTTVMPVPKPNPPLPGDEFVAPLSRWIYLTRPERDALIERMRTRPSADFARSHYLPWAAANFCLPTLPRAGVTLLPHSPEEEAALRAYWDGWAEQSDAVWRMAGTWPTLSAAQRAEALGLADLMAADFPLAERLRDWMRANLESNQSPRDRDDAAQPGAE